MITTSVRGHLASQDFPAEYGWTKCDPLALFEAPIHTHYKTDLQPLERMLSTLSQSCQVLILWLDCDREGEAIGDEVRKVCWSGNPRLAVFRAKFSTVLEAEIRRALQSLGRLNENFVQAVQARSELDLRVGAAFTRFQTLRLQRKFEGFSSEGVVSYGPCQFPTLGFVVERWARIEIFVPEAFWYIEMSLRVGWEGTAPGAGPPTGRSINFRWKRDRLYDRVATTFLYESCLEDGEAVVTELVGRPKNKWRPVPLATIELQKRASRFLRLGAEQLMSAAEELYQQGYISYPRTETEKFRPEFDHQQLIQQFANGAAGEFSDYANKLLTDNHFQNPRAGQNDDQAHPPITPCRAVDPNTIENETNRGVFKLVVKHYLACCSRDAIGKETQLVVQIDSEEFTATGLMILEKNWLEIYHPWESWSTGQGELPPLQVGSRILPASLLMKTSQTTPPQPITEVELISMMDRHGIGTDATIAQHISTIQDREYATKDTGMRFLPTKLGIALVESYNSMGYQLNKPDLRRETEQECNHVAAGRKTKEEIMTVLLAKMKQCYEAATLEAYKLDEAVARHFPRLGSSNDTTQLVQANFSICGVCRNKMELKQDRSSRGNVPPRKLVFCKTCRAGWGLPRGLCQPKIQTENVGLPVLCPICNYQVVQVLAGDGYTGIGYHMCPKCFTDPPAEHGGMTNGGDFRCFSCSHPTCALATGTVGGAVEVFNCPFCNDPRIGGKVCLKRNSRGFVLSCNKYNQGERCSYTIWLPKEAQTVSVPTADEGINVVCTRCSSGTHVVRKITLVWKYGSVPSHFGLESTVCLLCDADLRRDLQIALPNPNHVIARPRQASSTNGRGRGRGQPMVVRGGRGTSARSGQGRGNASSARNDRNDSTGSGMTCFKCGDPGHFANQCPSR